MQKEIRAWAEASHDKDDGEDVGVYVQIKGHRVWLDVNEAHELGLKIEGARRMANADNRRAKR